MYSCDILVKNIFILLNLSHFTVNFVGFMTVTGSIYVNLEYYMIGRYSLL